MAAPVHIAIFNAAVHALNTLPSPALGRELANLPANIRDGVLNTLRNWHFVPPQSSSAGQRQVQGGNWVSATPPRDRHVLSTGSSGAVHVWCRVNPTTELIEDRIVIKENVPGAHRFLDPRIWVHGNHGSEPLEVRLANRAWLKLDPVDRKHILNCLGWGDIRPHQFSFKLYYEYCEHGHLCDRILEPTHQLMPGKKTYKGEPRTRSTAFPEPFLWYLFRSLAKACEAMETATHITTTGIMHGDMQAGNIFFGAADPSHFGMYPVPKVADFGSARALDFQTVNRLGGLLGDACCLEYAPPELAKNPGFTQWEYANGQCSTKTNIWQMGMLMACAARLKYWLPEADWRRPPVGYDVPIAEQLRFNIHAPAANRGRRQMRRGKLTHGTKKYSNELITLIQWCMLFNPTSRPTAAQVLGYIQNNANFQGTDAQLAAGAKIPKRLDAHKIYIKGGRSDKWRVGKKMP